MILQHTKKHKNHCSWYLNPSSKMVAKTNFLISIEAFDKDMLFRKKPSDNL
jgi:hypothetical protein